MLLIDLRRQRLTLYTGNDSGTTARFTCPISSSLHGIGNEPGSLRTPIGHFAIAEKIGAQQPLGSVFRSRQPTGEIADPHSPDDQITTRILWLRGLDFANAHTHSRYIYLHGTNHETHLGLPASHGCIRLANPAIADLFDLVETDTPVLIQP